MKKLLATSLLLLASFNLHAEDANTPYDMFISLERGFSKYSPSIPSTSGIPVSDVSDSTYKTRASFAYQYPTKFGAQVDGVYSRNNIDFFNISTADLAGHIFYRGDKYLVGGFAQYRNLNLDSNSQALDKKTLSAFAPNQALWGIESQGYFDNITVYGQVAYQDFINQDRIPFSGLVGTLGDYGLVAVFKVSYFIGDDWKLDANYGYNKVYSNRNLNINSGNVISADQNIFGLSTEYRFTNNPVSLYASYEHAKLSILEAANVDTDRAMFGFKFNFGRDTLQSRNRGGASLDPISQDALVPTAISSILNHCAKGGCVNG